MASDYVYVVIGPVHDENAVGGVYGPRPVLYTTDHQAAQAEYFRLTGLGSGIGCAVLEWFRAAPDGVHFASDEIIHQFIGRTLGQWLQIHAPAFCWQMTERVCQVAMLPDDEPAALDIIDLHEMEVA